MKKLRVTYTVEHVWEGFSYDPDKLTPKEARDLAISAVKDSAVEPVEIVLVEEV